MYVEHVVFNSRQPYSEHYGSDDRKTQQLKRLKTDFGVSSGNDLSPGYN